MMDIAVSRAGVERKPSVPLIVAGLAALAVFWGEVGPAVTVATALCTYVVVGSFVLVYPAAYRRRRRIQEPQTKLGAEAMYCRRAGVIRILDDRLEWSRKGEETLMISEAEIATASLSPRRFVRATRMTLALIDGSELRFTITAPVKLVEEALSSSG